jgi:hypothetical protein
MAELLDIAGLRDRTTPRFRYELWRQASEAGLNPSYIAAVMRLESNFDPNIQNKGGAPALGLLQFWRDYFPAVVARAARARPELAGVQWEDLRRLDAVTQIPLVISYFEGVPALHVQSTPTDYYVATFMPRFVGYPSSTVLGRKGSDEFVSGTKLKLGTVYAQNAGLDVDKDGVITVGDIGRKVESVVSDAKKRAPIQVDDTDGETLPGLQAGLAPTSGYVLLLLPAFFLRGIGGSDGAHDFAISLRGCNEPGCSELGTMVDPTGRPWCQSHFRLVVNG